MGITATSGTITSAFRETVVRPLGLVYSPVTRAGACTISGTVWAFAETIIKQNKDMNNTKRFFIIKSPLPVFLWRESSRH
jgi:hypothetical protein